jgi:ribonuclease HI
MENNAEEMTGDEKLATKMGQVKIYIDGASRSNPGPSSIAVVVVHPDPEKSMVFGERVGNHTNNDAEFMALKKAVTICRENQWKDPVIYTDSRLVANVSVGKWRLKSASLQKIVEEIAHEMVETRRQLGKFDPYVMWVPRTNPMIMEADIICNRELNKII